MGTDSGKVIQVFTAICLVRIPLRLCTVVNCAFSAKQLFVSAFSLSSPAIDTTQTTGLLCS